MTYTLDSAVFRDDAITAETAALNADILAQLDALPDKWSIPPAITRDQRARGLGAFGTTPKCERAETISINGPHGEITLRIIQPIDGPIRGAYLHIHGGGWVLGAADQQDSRLDRIANNCGLAVVSVEYRLAPEHPYPQGPDDCEAAALWLVKAAPSLFGTSLLTIGGESAGAHLAVVTLLRLRDKHGLTPFMGANLTAGCYDLAGTPSAKAWGLTKLILSTRDMEMFVRHFLVHGGSTDDPDISPLNAKLHDMPYALFSIGTRDCLLDDSLFMAARWMAAGSACELAVYPAARMSSSSLHPRCPRKASAVSINSCRASQDARHDWSIDPACVRRQIRHLVAVNARHLKRDYAAPPLNDAGQPAMTSPVLTHPRRLGCGFRWRWIFDR